jgi:hypothetical protein
MSTSGDHDRSADEYPPRGKTLSAPQNRSRSGSNELADNPRSHDDVRELSEDLRQKRSPLSSKA